MQNSHVLQCVKASCTTVCLPCVQTGLFINTLHCLAGKNVVSPSSSSLVRELEDVITNLCSQFDPSQFQFDKQSIHTETLLGTVLLNEANSLQVTLKQVSSQLLHLLGYLKGNEEYTCKLGALLRSIVDNRAPEEWSRLLGINCDGGNTPTMATILKLVRSRIQFLLDCTSVGVPAAVHPTWFMCPERIPVALSQAYASHHQLSMEEVFIRATVSIVLPQIALLYM